MVLGLLELVMYRNVAKFIKLTEPLNAEAELNWQFLWELRNQKADRNADSREGCVPKVQDGTKALSRTRQSGHILPMF